MNQGQLLSALIGALLLIVLINATISYSLGSKLETKIGQLKEAARPANIGLVLISAPCDECEDSVALIQKIKDAHVNITSEKTLSFQSAEGKKILSDYGIEKLPAIVLEGEITKLSASGFSEKGEGLLYEPKAAPYYSVRSNRVEGKVDSWIIDAPCEKCSDMEEIKSAFIQSGVYFDESSTLQMNDAFSKQLMQKHNITKLPAIIFSDDISSYPETLAVMTQGGFKKSGDFHVYESQMPYFDVHSGLVRGLVDVTYLSDSSCTECYDVKIHKQILERFGMSVGKENLVDTSSSEGKGLLAQYSITSVPMVIVKGDVSLYTGFDKVWADVGSVEKDGAFVFRDNAVFGNGITYKDLKSGIIMNPPSEEADLNA